MTSFRLRANRQLIRARGSSVCFLLASITAPVPPARKDRMPVNIALVLDRSGSMQGENKFPLGEVDDAVVVTASLDDETTASVTFTYASQGANDDQPRDVDVDREVARVYAGLARAEATEAHRHGDFDRARRALVGTARHIEEYAGDDRALLALARALRDEVPEYAEQQMSPMALKRSLFVAESSVKGRSLQGKARRG